MSKSKKRAGCRKENEEAVRHTEISSDPQWLLRKHDEIKKQMDDAAKSACILFADLVGSTEYKAQRGPLNGLAKTDKHHELACACIKLHKGKVVKSLGDGIMGMFIGTHAERQALRAGLALLERVRVTNEEELPPEASDEDAIETAIGIHHGDVWMFSFPESKVEDPQGTTVDIAARLCALAGPQQLICTEETFQAAGANKQFSNAGCPCPRFVKGIPEALDVRMVLPVGDSRKCVRVPVSGHRRPIRSEHKEKLEYARQLFLKKDPESQKEAYDTFSEIVEKEPGNYDANCGLAELILQRKRGGLEELKEAEKHLCVAVQNQPRYFRVRLLMGWASFKKYEEHGDPDDLDRAVKQT
jgi:class 3 adenylate cyclase